MVPSPQGFPLPPLPSSPGAVWPRLLSLLRFTHSTPLCSERSGGRPFLMSKSPNPFSDQSYTTRPRSDLISHFPALLTSLSAYRPHGSARVKGASPASGCLPGLLSQRVAAWLPQVPLYQLACLRGHTASTVAPPPACPAGTPWHALVFRVALPCLIGLPSGHHHFIDALLLGSPPPLE